MKKLTIICPSCSSKADLSIEAEAEMVLLNCFQCKTPILYFHGETTQVDEVEMGKFQEESMKAIQGFLKIHHNKPLIGKNTRLIKNHLHRLDTPSLNGVVSTDDISNLKIDLHYCEDVLDTIKRL